MSGRSRIALTALTHGLALVAGWAVFAMGAGVAGRGDAGAAGAALPSAKASQRGGDGPAGSRSGVEREADELLAKLLKKPEDRQVADPERGPRQVSQELRDAIDSIAVPDDIGAALLAYVELMGSDKDLTPEQMLEMHALGYHWMARDPAGFFAWAGNDEGRWQLVNAVVMQEGPELYRRLGAEAVLKAVMAGKQPHTQMLLDLADSAARSFDSAGIALGKKTLSRELWQQFGPEVGRNWPPSREADLIKLAVENDMPILLVGHKAFTADQGRFLAPLLADPSLPQGFKDFIQYHPLVRGAFARDAEVPLEQRLQFGGGTRVIAESDVARILDGEQDLAYAFRTGEMNADEVWAEVIAGSPEMAKEHSGALQNHLFRTLAEENPAEAMKLLKDMPAEQRDSYALFVARTNFHDVEPQKFLELLEQVPSDTPERWDGRLDAWNRRAFTNNERLEDGYVEWVQALQPGLDREMALYSLARAVAGPNPQLAQDLRAQVGDPELKRRIAEHR